MINFNVLKRGVSILSFAACLFGGLDSAAQVRYIPVDDFSEFNPCQVFAIGGVGVDVAASYYKDSKDVESFPATSASVSEDGLLIPENTDGLLEFTLERLVDYFNSDYSWRFRINTGTTDLFAYDNSAKRLYTVRDDTNNTFHYALKFENSSDGSTQISFHSSRTNEANIGYLRFVETSEGGYVLTCTTDLEKSYPVKLYLKDVYDLYVVNPKPVWTKGDKVQIHINVYPDTDKYSTALYYYAFSNELKYPTQTEIYNLTRTYGRQSDYADSGILELEYPGGDVTLWVQVSQDGGYEDKSDCMNYRFIESKGNTNVEAGHFTPPAEHSYTIGEGVEFVRENDVKIYYTLDGSDPDINNVSTSRGGITYDLDEDPIIYTGTTLNIRYVAVKEGYAPTDVMTLTVSGATAIATIEENGSAKAIYYDLSGRPSAEPLLPGFYLRVTGDRTEKVVIK